MVIAGLSIFSCFGATHAAILANAASYDTTPYGPQLAQRAVAPPPSQDSFYVSPAGYATKAAGSILRSRKLASNNYPKAPISASYQVLYRTNTAINKAASAVTTVLIPPKANYTRIYSHQTPYDQAFIDCSPSYAFTPGSPTSIQSTLAGDVSGPITDALNCGYVVSIPDYEIHAAWTDGLGSGRGVLDSIRAVRASGSAGTGVSPHARTAIYGFSGGSTATEWASEIYSTYAPDLNIVGAAMGGLPVNLTTASMALNGQPNAGYISASFVGLAKAYPAFNTALNKDLIPEGAGTFKTPGSSCKSSWQPAFAGQDIWSKYLKSGSEFLSLPDPSRIVANGAVMGRHGTPKAFPIYVFKGTADEIVPTIEETDDLISGYCAAGAKITYVRYAGATHVRSQQLGQSPAVAFAFAMLEGDVGPSSCSISTVSK